MMVFFSSLFAAIVYGELGIDAAIPISVVCAKAICIIWSAHDVDCYVHDTNKYRIEMTKAVQAMLILSANVTWDICVIIFPELLGFVKA